MKYSGNKEGYLALKSDLRGIETTKEHYLFACALALKSDLRGIETGLLFVSRSCYHG